MLCTVFTAQPGAARAGDREAAVLERNRRSHAADTDRAGNPVTGGLDHTRRKSGRPLSGGAQAAGLASTTAASVLAVVLMASHALAVTDPSTTVAGGVPGVVLTASDSANPFQPMLEKIIQAQQQISDTNSAYPFITDFDKTLLPAYLQASAMDQLFLNVGQLNLDNFYNLHASNMPYLWNAPGAEPQNFLNSPSPDNVYNLSSVGDKTEVITVHPGPGTADASVTTQSGTGTSVDFSPLHSYDLSKFTPNADGTYTIYVSPTQHSGNWVDSAEAQTLVIRDNVGDWGLPHDTFTIQVENQPAFVLPVLSDNQISSMLTEIASNLPIANASGTLFGLQAAENSLPDNAFTPLISSAGSSVGGPALPGQVAAAGHFALDPDQALIVKVPDIDAKYSSVQLSDAWSGVPASVTAQSSFNNTQVFNAGDGYTCYVVSSQDPGVANWLNDSDLKDGNILLRWQGVTGDLPTARIQTEVVNVADVRNALPADTPIVTPAERAADLQQHLLEYGYIQDQEHNFGWLTANLEDDQIKAAIGVSQFDSIFGSQQDVPSVLDRLTSTALSPDLSTLAHDILTTNPQDTLSAVVQNLPVLLGDIEWPIVLAALRLDLLLAGAPGASTLQTILSETLTDPGTSITAGLLNIRDDLAVSIMNAGNYEPLTSGDFTSVLDQLSQLGQSVSQALSAGISALGV